MGPPRYRFRLERHQEEGLALIAAARGVSRDELVRRAVVAYLSCFASEIGLDDTDLAAAGEPDLKAWAHDKPAFT